MTSVIIVEDFPLVLQAISRVIDAQHDMQVVESCIDAASARAAACQHQPDVVVLDLHLHPMRADLPCNTIALIEDVTRQTRARIVAYSASEHPSRVAAALDAGAACYVSKRQHADDLVDAIRRAAAGDRYVGPHVAASVIDASRRVGGGVGMSAHDAELIQLLGAGLTDAQIAQHMFLSRRTIQNRMVVLRERTDTADRHELIRWARDHDWITSTS